jgi:hypothetical protein
MPVSFFFSESNAAVALRSFSMFLAMRSASDLASIPSSSIAAFFPIDDSLDLCAIEASAKKRAGDE